MQHADLVGVSIIGVPNAFGYLDNRLQRYLSRAHLMRRLEEGGELSSVKHQGKLHFLGMLDGPNEVHLVKDYHRYINSCDSSSAIWFGLNDGRYDQSPTGQRDGKYEEDVDFDFHTNNSTSIVMAKLNAEHINDLISEPPICI